MELIIYLDVDVDLHSCRGIRAASPFNSRLGTGHQLRGCGGGGGEATKREVGASEVLPLQEGGGVETVWSHPEGGGGAQKVSTL